MSKITSGMNLVLPWLAAWWGYRRAPEVVRQYQVMREICPEAMADLARFCLAFDNTFDPDNAHASDRNQGKREVWLYLEAMTDLDWHDLQVLKQKTENDDGNQ
jgi:hypothetical protein